MSGESKEKSVIPAEDMEQRLSYWIEELHKRAPDSIGDLLCLRAA